MAPYDIAQFLLDKANIQDAAEKMYMFFDMKLYEKLQTEVFAEHVRLDYTELFGGEPREVDSASLIEEWRSLGSRIADSQHCITSIIPELPQPAQNSVPPTEVKALANTVVIIKSYKNNLVENKGRGILNLVKLPETSGNPWRVCGIQAHLVWQSDVSFEQLAKDFAEHTGS